MTNRTAVNKTQATRQSAGTPEPEVDTSAVDAPVVDEEHIQSLERGLRVLTSFTPDTPYFTLAEVATTTGLSRAAARRVILTLQALGYVGTDGRTFFLLPRVLEIGHAYLASSRIGLIGQPHLESLNQAVGEAASMGVISGAQVVYIARSQGLRRMTTDMNVGAKLEATSTAVGRVLLAHMAEDALERLLAQAAYTPLTEYSPTSAEQVRERLVGIRERGWEIADQEVEIGFIGAAAPVHGVDGEVVAGVTVGVHSGRVALDEVRETIIPQVLATAKLITEHVARAEVSGLSGVLTANGAR